MALLRRDWRAGRGCAAQDIFSSLLYYLAQTHAKSCWGRYPELNGILTGMAFRSGLLQMYLLCGFDVRLKSLATYV